MRGIADADRTDTGFSGQSNRNLRRTVADDDALTLIAMNLRSRRTRFFDENVRARLD